MVSLITGMFIWLLWYHLNQAIFRSYSTNHHQFYFFPVNKVRPDFVWPLSSPSAAILRSSFSSLFFFISSVILTFYVRNGRLLLLWPFTSNFWSSTSTFSPVKAQPYHRLLLAFAIISKNSSTPNMLIFSKSI